MQEKIGNVITRRIELPKIPIDGKGKARDRSIKPSGYRLSKKRSDKAFRHEVVNVDGIIKKDVGNVVDMPRGVKGV